MVLTIDGSDDGYSEHDRTQTGNNSEYDRSGSTNTPQKTMVLRFGSYHSLLGIVFGSSKK